MPNHETGSGFAVSTGHADDVDFLAGEAIDGTRNYGLGEVVGKYCGIIEGEFFELLFHIVYYITSDNV